MNDFKMYIVAVQARRSDSSLIQLKALGELAFIPTILPGAEEHWTVANDGLDFITIGPATVESVRWSIAWQPDLRSTVDDSGIDGLFGECVDLHAWSKALAPTPGDNAPNRAVFSWRGTVRETHSGGLAGDVEKNANREYWSFVVAPFEPFQMPPDDENRS